MFKMWARISISLLLIPVPTVNDDADDEVATPGTVPTGKVIEIDDDAAEATAGGTLEVVPSGGKAAASGAGAIATDDGARIAGRHLTMLTYTLLSKPTSGRTQ